jgi:glutamate/tyrosine decarboxylase-like PLP-dependent enzyme
MSVPKVAAILALVGVVTFISTMVVHWNETAVGVLSYGGTICLMLAAFIFLTYVTVKSWKDAKHSN